MTPKNSLQPSYSLHIVPTFIPIGHFKAVKPYSKDPLIVFHLSFPTPLGLMFELDLLGYYSFLMNSTCMLVLNIFLHNLLSL